MAKKSRRKSAAAPRKGPVRIAVQLKQADAQARVLDGLKTLLNKAGYGDAVPRMTPLISSLNDKQLAQLIDRAQRNDPTYVPANFAAWYQFVPPDGLNAEELVRGLRELGEIERAYVMRPVPPPVMPGDDPRNANQGYQDAAPNGIDARYAWGFPGGDGAGVGFVDMEQGWNLNHEDLVGAGVTIISGTNTAYFFHGTGVLGEVLMTDNALGGVGIVPSVSGRVISQYRPDGSYNTPDAIVDAAAHMAFGDVLLLEAQDYDPVDGATLMPVEVVDATYEAIRLATALGVAVVEAGANGGADLDAYVDVSGHSIFNRTSADFRDSGAIMVGAGSSAAPHSRLGFSSQGNRIDCYGWGQNVDTASTNGAGTDNTAYTSTFNGTSSASPIVTGAALAVQGLAQSSLGYRFSPRALREILKIDGTPSADPPNDRIGVMPDLHAIIANTTLNLAPDIFLRDYVGDDGNPTSGAVSQSPDIIVRQAAVADPQGSFGAGSGTENNASLSDDVDTGHDNFVYVRVQNRGGTAAANVSVDVYWSPPSTLVTPNLWNFIGTANLASVPVGDVLTVADPVVWHSADIPAPGHYCFVAVADAVQDPRPSPTAFTTFANYLTYVENNNNVAWRNFNVVIGPPSPVPPPGFYSLPFNIAGAFDTGHVFAFEALGRLPEKSRAILEVPAWLADALRPHSTTAAKIDEKTKTIRFPLNPRGTLRLGSALLHARVLAKCRLLVHIPSEQRKNDYHFAVRQLYREREVGRVTWNFAADDKRAAGKTPKGRR